MKILALALAVAALFAGWTLGPLASKCIEWLKEWNDRNLAESKRIAKQYSISGVWFINPDGAENKKTWIAAFEAALFFLSLLAAFIFQTLFFWKLLTGVILLLVLKIVLVNFFTGK